MKKEFNKYLKETYPGLRLAEGNGYLYWTTYSYASVRLRTYVYTRFTCCVLAAKFSVLSLQQWKEVADIFMKDYYLENKDN